MRLKKLTARLLIGTTLILPITSSFAVFYQNHGRPDAPERTVERNLETLNQNVKGEIKKYEEGYIKNIQTNTEKIVEAVRVATAQEALSSAQIGKADKNAKQVLVNALLADMQTEAALDAMLRFSPTMGQGYAACTVLAKNSQIAQVMDTVQDQAAVKVDEIDSSPNAMSNSSADALNRRMAVHNENFCTDAEGKQGSCKPASEAMQGADSNAATLLVSAPANSEVARAKQAVRQNILGSPTVAIPSSVASTASGQAYLYSVNHKTALSAFPAYSLAYLESMSEVREDVKDADGNPQSPNDMLFNTVARYYGGKDSGEWQASMISQQPRGLLVELAKMEGLGAWMDYQEYLAMQRMEGNLAAMTLTAAIPMEQRLNKQYQRANSAAIRDNAITK